MKVWREASQVYAEMERLRAAGRRCALATLTRVKGSAYRRPGARLLIRDDGIWLGNVSGGCLESDLRERAQRVIASGQPESVHYVTGGDTEVAWGLGLGCNGELDLWLEPGPVAGCADLLQRLAGEDPINVSAGEFRQTLAPPPHLIVAGAGDDAVPLVRYAAEAGFRVWVLDHRPAWLRDELFPDAWQRRRARPEQPPADLPRGARVLAVVKNHHLEIDRAWAGVLAAADVRYLGLLGPRARRDNILASLPDEARVRCHGPAGLDIGAEGPEQIAISIVAELLADWTGRAAGFLRDRTAPLHTP
jgi:xanthine dehydrogenase accessory factor